MINQNLIPTIGHIFPSQITDHLDMREEMIILTIIGKNPIIMTSQDRIIVIVLVPLQEREIITTEKKILAPDLDLAHVHVHDLDLALAHVPVHTHAHKEKTLSTEKKIGTRAQPRSIKQNEDQAGIEIGAALRVESLFLVITGASIHLIESQRRPMNHGRKTQRKKNYQERK